MRRQIVIGAMMVLTMIVLMAAAPPSGPEIYVAPADTTVFMSHGSDSFVVSICVSSDIADLMGWDITVEFDPSIVTLKRAEEGSLPLNSGFETFFWRFDPEIPDDTGHINGAILGKTVDGPGALFDLVFEKTAVGTTYVEITATEIRNAVNNSIPHTIVDGMIIVESTIAVEPATWGQIKEQYR